MLEAIGLEEFEIPLSSFLLPIISLFANDRLTHARNLGDLRMTVINVLRSYFIGGECINLNWLREQLVALETTSGAKDRDYIKEVLEEVKKVDCRDASEDEFRKWVGIQIQLPYVTKKAE